MSTESETVEVMEHLMQGAVQQLVETRAVTKAQERGLKEPDAQCYIEVCESILGVLGKSDFSEIIGVSMIVLSLTDKSIDYSDTDPEKSKALLREAANTINKAFPPKALS